MDTVEARAILDGRVAQLRQQSYEELRDTWLGKPDAEDHTGASGAWYQVEIEGLWDDEKARHLRLVISIDQGAWRSMMESFIVAPDGSFIGE
jgi:hypothetical protein